jgi:hypothetical protein
VIEQDVRMLREVTVWSQAPYSVPNHDYLVNSTQEKLIAYRKEGHTEWEKFTKPLTFSKTRRKFKNLKEEIPSTFIKPFQDDPWNNTSYNSLESFF